MAFALRPVFASLAALLAATLASAELYTDASQLPDTVYDFVVVGAGTAGNVMAARLSENPKFTVLVIEAGISNEGVRTVEVPFLATQNIPATATTWNYTTVPQVGLGNRSVAYPRGRVLGGSSSINFLAYTRGADAEFDRWANLTGDAGWAWSNLAPYYLKNARLVPPADHHNTSGQVVPADHGYGPLEMSLPGFATSSDQKVLATTQVNGSLFPYNIDLNSGNSVGIGLTQSTLGGGERSSSATAYLEPALNRPNLHLLIENTVTKLVSSKGAKGVPTFTGVEFASSASAPRHTVTARKEVILSAGAIGSPQILLLSGVGNSTDLKGLGIAPVANLPDVGQNLKDHPILSNYWQVTLNDTFDDIYRDTSVFNAKLAQWNSSRTGLFADSPTNALGFLRIPDNAAIWSQFKDPAAGRQAGHFELLFLDGYAPAPAPGPGNYFTINTAVVTPESVGTVKLNSSSPFAFPLIDPGFFTAPFDVQAMVYAIKSARAFMQSAPWAGVALSRVGPVGDAESDADIIAAARAAARTIYHPTSTARMAPDNAAWGVVDTQLRVKGVSGLRVVDASVFPSIPAAHPQAAVYILAERAADLVKQAWSH
ncbi:aryl-alcohol oxidase-like protein [Phanerochaete sordida]|uniref:Aryl-alcohol oxidase-like protein n=1 Tax=Phanerochaete sordida TaxID=48140 RepID=A0A9P3GSQ7_9APHY|nr:aryl-alcohol oxidase-like protein [Phanerochaete sordida]